MSHQFELQKAILQPHLFGKAQQQQQIDQSLQCGICLSEYTDPRALPCLHTFCADCLRNLPRVSQASLSCPMCRCRHNVTDVANLPKNFYLDQLREAAAVKSPSPPRCLAEDCQSRPVAFCECCSDPLCLRHLNAHSTALLADCRTVTLEAREALRTGEDSARQRSDDLQAALNSLKNRASQADAALARLSDIITNRRIMIANQTASLSARLKRQSEASANRMVELSTIHRLLVDAVELEDLCSAKKQLQPAKRLLAACKLENSSCESMPSSLLDAFVNLDALKRLETDLKNATAMHDVSNEALDQSTHVEFSAAPAAAAAAAASVPNPPVPQAAFVGNQALLVAPRTPKALPCDFRPVDLVIARHIDGPLWCHPELGLFVGAQAPKLTANSNHNDSQTDNWALVRQPVIACLSDCGELHFMDANGKHVAKLALDGVKASRLCECPTRNALVLADAVAGLVLLWCPSTAVGMNNSTTAVVAASASVWQPRGLASAGQTIYVASPGAVHLLDCVTMATVASIRRPFKSADAVAAWPDSLVQGGFVVSDCAEGKVHLFSAPAACHHLNTFACPEASFIEVGLLLNTAQRRRTGRCYRQFFASRSRRHSVLAVNIDDDTDDADGLPRVLTVGNDNGEKGSAPGQVNCPLGLRFDAPSGCLFVCDFYNYRLQVFPV